MTYSSPHQGSAHAMPRPGALRFSFQRGRGDALDEGMAMAAFVGLPLDLPLMEPFRPFILLAVVGWIALRWRSLLPALVKFGWAFALAGLCILSMLWAADPAAAIRHGSLIGVGVMVGIAVATRLDARQMAVALLLSQGGLALASAAVIAAGGGDSSSGIIGIFPQKNVLGQRLVFLLIAGAVVLSGKGFAPQWRAFAALIMALALGLLAQTQSASGVILAAMGIMIVFGLAWVWGPAAKVRGARSLIITGGMAVSLFGLIVLTAGLGVDPVADGLAAFGKDSSLTGRTDLWAVGERSVSEHPILGVGAGNFWRSSTHAASRIAEVFNANPHTFSFHNAWMEIIVHLGAVGLVAGVVIFGRGALTVVVSALRGGAQPLFLALMAVFMVRSFVESELFVGLTLGPILFWATVVGAAQVRWR